MISKAGVCVDQKEHNKQPTDANKGKSLPTICKIAKHPTILLLEDSGIEFDKH